MCITALAGDVSEYRFLRCELQYLGDLDVRIVPLEDEEASGLQHAEAFRKTFRQHIPPIGINAPYLIC